MKKELKPIPEFKNEEEEFEFWSTADTSEYLDPEGWHRVPAPMVPMTKDVILLRLLADMTPEVERLSRENKLTIEEMVRQLVAAGLRQQRLQPRI